MAGISWRAHCVLTTQQLQHIRPDSPIHEYGRDLGNLGHRRLRLPGSFRPFSLGKYLFADFGSGRLWAANGDFPRTVAERTSVEHRHIHQLVRGRRKRRTLRGGLQRHCAADCRSGRTPACRERGWRGQRGQLSSRPLLFPAQSSASSGSGIGPDQGAGAILDPSGRVDNFVADTWVLFDGTQAPLFYVQANQINAQVPHAVAGKPAL